MRIIATAKITPGKHRNLIKRVKHHRKVPDPIFKEPIEKIVNTDWNRDPQVTNQKGKGKGTVTLCISMPPQMFTDLYLFARKMRMNHSHLMREAVMRMMKAEGWNHGETS